MINLRSIEIEGFGSVIKPIKYKIGVVGLNKIEGANGAGKTTITNALAWVGWGKLVKPRNSSIIPWPHVIDNHYHGTKVSLKFNDGVDKYQIIRCNEYKPKIYGLPGKNRLIILKNGTQLEGQGLRDKKDYQNWIIKKIGYSFDLFKSTVLFTQELDNLMKEDGPSRKRIFDEAFETTFVNRAKEMVEERIEKLDKEWVEIQQKLEIGRVKIKFVERGIKEAKESLANFEKVKRSRLNEILDKAVSLRSKLNELNGELIQAIPINEEMEMYFKRLEGWNDLVTEEFRTNMQMNAALSNVETREKDIKDLKEQWANPVRKCDKCGSVIKNDRIVEYKEGIKNKITIAKMNLGKEIKKYERLKKRNAQIKRKMKKLERLRKKVSQLRAQITPIALLQSLIDNTSNNIKEREMEIEKLKDEKPLSNKIPGLKDELTRVMNVFQANILIRKDIKKRLMIDKWLIKDPLSNSGLKAFIFDSMLGRVNNYLKYYTPIIGFGIKVFVDMASANKDIRISIDKGGDEVPYEDLSKGQTQLVHVAIAFSLSDAVQSIKPINAIFLDELFESLNTENIEKVSNIIIRKSQNKCVHLITHRTAFTPPNCNITTVVLNPKGQTEVF